MIFKRTFLVLGVLLSTLVLHADEGMWLPSLLNKINMEKMHQMGAKLSAADIYDINNASLKDAIVALNEGSCTGEMVSSQGLFLTNHHCGYGQIQQHSSEEMNILRDGFWAQSREDELNNPGMSVWFLIRVEDVSERVLANVNGQMSEQERKDSINSIIVEITKEAKDDTHYEAQVKPIFNNNQYLLFVYEIFKDVRLVGAPPHFIGKFGGDTDNWMWPRHTGDFALFRVYTAPDGTPAEYSEENIPLEPRHYLPISLKGFDEGDFAMVMGYPGSTNRYLTSGGVEYTMEIVNETRIQAREPKLKIIRDYMATSELATIKYASKHARSSNYHKYSIGQNRGIQNLDLVDKKKKIEAGFTAWVNEDEARVDVYGKALPIIEEAYSNVEDDRAMYYVAEAFLRGPEIFMAAQRLESLASALKNKSDDERIESISNSLKEKLDDFFKDYDSETDQKIVAALTEVYVKNVDEKYHPDFIKTINRKYKGDYSAWAASLFKKSFINDKDDLLDFLENPKLRKLEKDPVFAAGRSISKASQQARDDYSDDKEKLDHAYRLFMKGLLEMHPDSSFYPNANSTMRLTYGSVGGYVPRDAVKYNYYTTMSGYIEKEIPGDREFDVWPRLKELYFNNEFGRYANAEGELVTGFITNNDITGGNSGSPVINANGELIGIAFDGNWEAMSGDIVFEPELQKCINVDIRFVLWVIDVFAEAGHLVDEMSIVE
jgi:hypothetical protein